MHEPPAVPLWTRYVDWCSARVAERFLELSAEEVWERADRQRRASSNGAASAPDPWSASYLELVRGLTLQLFVELELPGFDEWVQLYRANPGAYEAEMVGFAIPDRVPGDARPAAGMEHA